MNLNRDLECCLRPDSFWRDQIVHFDESHSDECCFGWCRPCTACFCQCVWIAWLKKCAAPVAHEVCPDVTGCCRATNSAEPCSACGHVCVLSIRCLKAAVCCAGKSVWSAYAVLMMLGTVAVLAFTVARYAALASMVVPQDYTMQDAAAAFWQSSAAVAVTDPQAAESTNTTALATAAGSAVHWIRTAAMKAAAASAAAAAAASAEEGAGGGGSQPAS